MGLRGCLNNFLTRDGQKEDKGTYYVKFGKTGDFAQIPDSSRTPTTLTNEKIEEVEELILSQEENPGTHESQRNIGRIIDISQSSVSRICRQSLGLTAFCKTKVQGLSDAIS